jgi:hypothetical protein
VPKVFTLWDALTFGLMALLVTILALVVTFNGRNKHKSWWQWGGLYLVVVMFWAGYVGVVKWRYDLKQRVTCVTAQGTIFVKDGGVAPDCTELTNEIERVLEAWRKVPDFKVIDNLDLMVFVKPMPFELHKSPGNKFAGFAKPYDHMIAVGFDGRPVEQTALAHELGHIILFHAGKKQDEETFKSYADQYGVPY